MSEKAVDTWSAPEYNKAASFVYSTENTAPILMLLDPKPGDKIIDFGCGSGEVTLELSQAVEDSGIIVGIDSSWSMASTIVLSITSSFSPTIAGRQGQGKRAGKRLRPRHPGPRR